MPVRMNENISIYEFTQLHQLDARTVNIIKNIVGAWSLRDPNLKVSDLKAAIRNKGWVKCRGAGKKTAALLAELLGLPEVLSAVEQNTHDVVERLVAAGEDREQVTRLINKIIQSGYTFRKNKNKIK